MIVVQDVTAKGGDAEKIIQDVNAWSLPAWSPDGRYICFGRIGDKQNSGYYISRFSDTRDFKAMAEYPEELSWTIGWSKDDGYWIIPVAGGTPGRIMLETEPKVWRFSGDPL